LSLEESLARIDARMNENQRKTKAALEKWLPDFPVMELWQTFQAKVTHLQTPDHCKGPPIPEFHPSCMTHFKTRGRKTIKQYKTQQPEVRKKPFGSKIRAGNNGPKKN